MFRSRRAFRILPCFAFTGNLESRLFFVFPETRFFVGRTTSLPGILYFLWRHAFLFYSIIFRFFRQERQSPRVGWFSLENTFVVCSTSIVQQKYSRVFQAGTCSRPKVLTSQESYPRSRVEKTKSVCCKQCRLMSPLLNRLWLHRRLCVLYDHLSLDSVWRCLTICPCVSHFRMWQ